MQPTPPAGEQRSWAKATGFLIALYLVGLAMIAGVVLVANKSGSGGSGGSSASGGGAGATIPVTLTEFKIEGDLMASPGPITLEVTNKGSMDHDLTVTKLGKSTGTFATGKTVKLDLGDVPAGEYEVTCEVPGHKDSGMKATLKVMEGMDHSAASSGSTEAAASEGSAAGSGEGTMNYAQMDKDMVDSFAKFPAKTKGEGNQSLQPTILPDGTKHFELTAAITDWEVEPGKVVKAWTYNGMVPAPRIMLNVGDKIEVELHNKLPVATDIHWHGITVPFDQDGVAPITQKPIEPGQDFTYHFTVDKPEMGMYHPHLHGQMTLPNGMFGQIQVGPTPLANGKTVAGVTIPSDVKPVLDFPMVLNDAGVIGFALNGKSFPATAPIVVKEGDWVTMTYYNEGLQSHPMHLHQFPQLVTAIDGIALDSPYWADTVLVAPGQRYTVMFHANRKGTWVFHCHILNHAERETGMFGMVSAVVVQ